MNLPSFSHLLLSDLTVCMGNSLEQPLSHVGFANQPIFKFCFPWPLTSTQAGRGKVVSWQFKKRRKGQASWALPSYRQQLSREQPRNTGYVASRPCGVAERGLSDPLSLNPEVRPIQGHSRDGGKARAPSPLPSAACRPAASASCSPKRHPKAA